MNNNNKNNNQIISVNPMTKMLINISNGKGQYYECECFYGVVKPLLIAAKESNMKMVKIPVTSGEIQTIIELPLDSVEQLVYETEKQAMQMELNKDIIPKELREYFYDYTMCLKYSDSKSIVGRKNEIDKCWFHLSQELRNNVFLIGQPDVGKTAIACELARRINAGDCPEKLKNKRFITINADALHMLFLKNEKAENVISAITLGGKSKISEAERVLQKIEEFFEEHKEEIILFVDDSIYMLYNYNMLRMLYYIIKDANIPFIATSLPKEFEMYFLRNPRISKFLNYIYVDEIPEYKMKPVIDSFIKYFKAYYEDIGISDKIIKMAIYTSSLDKGVSANPGRTINIVRKAFAEAERRNKKYVDRKCILSCYDINLDEYDSVDKRKISKTAYHEAGHYLGHKLLNRVKDIKTNCVSILPMMNWRGININTYDSREYVIQSADYYKDLIAICLAGRVAETIVNNNNYTIGAIGDLQSVDYYANIIVTRCALNNKGKYKNRVYNHNNDFRLSEEKKEYLDDEIQEVIDEGLARAEKMINDNKELLKIIAEKLIKEEILTTEELDRICKKYFKDKEAQNKD